MKKFLATLLICLLPVKALAFELTFSVDFNGMFAKQPDILKVAMGYNGYEARKNRKELKEISKFCSIEIAFLGPIL